MMDPFDAFDPLEVPVCDESEPNADHGANDEDEMDVDDNDDAAS